MKCIQTVVFNLKQKIRHYSPSMEFQVPKTGIFYHPSFQLHDMGKDHFERPARTRIIKNCIRNQFLSTNGIVWEENVPEITIEQLLLFHTETHVTNIMKVLEEAASSGDIFDVDEDTAVMGGTREAALRAAGAVCLATDRVLNGTIKNAFCIVRPPGHHAEPDCSMGFCLFNNVGIAALHARNSNLAERIAIVDFDVHHGNGTQAKFEDDPNTLFISSHQSAYGFYPGTGDEDEKGTHGTIHNHVMDGGDGSVKFRKIMEEKVVPALKEFNPDLILISCGFDAHQLDPLADIQLQSEDYGWVTKKLVEVAAECCDGKIVSVLEGGYNLQALADSSVQHVQELINYEPSPKLDVDGSVGDDVKLEAEMAKISIQDK